MWIEGGNSSGSDTITPGTFTPGGPLTRVPTYIIDGGGGVISTGVRGQLWFPMPCTIQGVTLLADQSGSVVVDIWKVPYSSYNLPTAPTATNSITASSLPTLSSAVKYQDFTLTGWTTQINANDTLVFNVNSVTTIQRLTIQFQAL